ncbi:hypothetical protein D5086_026891 [Populus alba]|uniref:Uncharacterized protein n=1 Tax=Populus alba TaxID=43335 RepID=A0ACC4B3I1_POPAL
MVGPLKFEGPCTAPVTLKVQGTLKAPSDPKRLRDDWVAFRNVEGLTVSGGGIFDGQGAIAWWSTGHLCNSSGSENVSVEVEDINLVYNGKEGSSTSLCANVKPQVSRKIFPATCSPSA